MTRLCRYFSQASSELTESWTLMKSGQPGVPEPAAWLCSQLCAGQTVGVDPRLVPAREAKDLQTQLGSSSITLVGTRINMHIVACYPL